MGTLHDGEGSNVPLRRDFTAKRVGPSESTESKLKKGCALFVFVLIACDGRTRLRCPDICKGPS